MKKDQYEVWSKRLQALVLSNHLPATRTCHAQKRVKGSLDLMLAACSV
jgi:hypothetical protein